MLEGFKAFAEKRIHMERKVTLTSAELIRQIVYAERLTNPLNP